MTCLKCREQGLESIVELLEIKDNPRAVENLLRFVCPICGWEGGPYAV